MVTLGDIATRCSLSKTTVSVILSGKHRRYNISPETVERVLAVAEEIGYSPNIAARSLKLGRTHTLGVGVYDISYLTSAPFALLFAGAAQRAAEHEYRLELCTTNPAAKHGAGGRLHFLTKARVSAFDGLIIYDQIVPEIEIRAAVEWGVPVLLVERMIADAPRVSSIRTDYEGTVRSIVSEMLSRGYSDVALVLGLPESYRTLRILEGYRRGLEDVGCPYDPDLLLIPETILFAPVVKAVSDFITTPRPPTALICWDEDAARYALHAIRDKGLSVPEQFGVFSLVDCPAEDECSHVSSLATHSTSIGAMAADNLLKMILHDAEPEDRILHPEIIWRESTL